MTLKVYDVGDVVRCPGQFLNASLVATDPNTVTFNSITPSGVITTSVYPTDAALVKDSTGNYHVDVSVTEPGEWHYQWVGEGAVQAAEPGQFFAQGGPF
jgi:hypothetical protein